MQHNGTSVRTADAIVAPLAGLTCGEMAVALGASDMPDDYEGADLSALEQLTQWTVQGVDRIGLGEVERRANLTRYLETWPTRHTETERAQWCRLWPAEQRHRHASDNAWTLVLAHLRGITGGAR